MSYDPAHPIHDHRDPASVLPFRTIGDLRIHGRYQPASAEISLALPGWLLLCIGGGFAMAALFPADEWFQALRHPSFAPPDWLFAPVWFLLYILMAVAMWSVGKVNTPRARTACAMFIAQLGLNFLWTYYFFGLHSIVGALVIIVALLGSIVATMVAFRRVEPSSAALLLPYLAWVAFVAVLNAGYADLNADLFAFLK